MTDPIEAMAAQLLKEGFERAGPAAAALSDPIADTPMVVTLDQLRPYELNPRVTRNPLYDDIKASIRERGLDAPPAITRRPNESHYIIRNGGNTRLAILRELWSETRQEQFFRIACRFRPWPARGEIMALTGHLAENELHGSLSFIERATGVEKARELYELEAGKPVSQTELARLLSADGYPISQSHVSRMQDAVEYLLPAIPTLLYGGLGRSQVSLLAALRRSAARAFDLHATSDTAIDFLSLFQEVLGSFDHEGDAFALPRVRDELVAHMAEVLGVDYDVLNLDLEDMGPRQPVVNRALPDREPSVPDSQSPRRVAPSTEGAPASPDGARADPAATDAPTVNDRSLNHTPAPGAPASSSTLSSKDRTVGEPMESAIPSGQAGDRLQHLRRMLTDHGPPHEGSSATITLPLHADGLYPVTDLWTIETHLDSPEQLRAHIAQLAIEIVAQDNTAGDIESTSRGIGYRCRPTTLPATAPVQQRARWALLTILSIDSLDSLPPTERPVLIEGLSHLGALLLGASPSNSSDGPSGRPLGDTPLIKLFRLIRLARRLIELAGAQPDAVLGTTT